MALFDPKVPAAEHQAALDEIDDLSRQIADLQARIERPAPSEWLETVMTKRLLVHLKDGSTIDGSLVARMDDGIVLRAARLLSDGAAPTAMAGEAFIPRENVAFAQLDS